MVNRRSARRRRAFAQSTPLGGHVAPPPAIVGLVGGGKVKDVLADRPGWFDYFLDDTETQLGSQYAERDFVWDWLLRRLGRLRELMRRL
jgi:hypothetical protein